MNVPFVDLRGHHKMHEAKLMKKIKRICRAGNFIESKEVKAFEQEFSDYIGVAHTIGLNSGTDALTLGLRALDLPTGSEILIPANTYFSAGLAVLLNNNKPVFVDVDLHDYGIDLDDMKKKITQRTRAVITTHLYGQADKIENIQNIIKNKGGKIHLVEDAAQAHGACYNKKRVGGFGTFAAFSFYPTKNLGAYGDGGAITTNDDKLARKISMLKSYGQSKKNHHDILGGNSRLDEIQAAILRVHLQHLDVENAKRQKNAKLYEELLNDTPNIVTPLKFANRKSVYHLYAIMTPRRAALQKYLKEHGVQTQVHYPIPLHLQPAFSKLGYKRGGLPNAEKIARRILSLPMFPHISTSHITYVVKKVNTFFNNSLS